MSDWNWFFSSSNRREHLLRDQVDSLHDAMNRQYARAGRLSSRLARVQGSLEQRLDALSRAFDAYVELGDVRMDLLQFTGTETVRRAADEAMDALRDGRRVPDVPDDPQYWLSAATRALIAHCAGSPDEQLEREAYALEPRAELFAVAALGALGHGASAADRIASLLVTDAGLDADQVVLWRAVCAGLYGPDALPAVLAAWPLDRSDAALRRWTTWLEGRAISGHELVWLREQAVARPVPAPPPPPIQPPRPSVPPVAAGPADYEQPPFLAERTASTATAPAQPDVVEQLRDVVDRLVAEGRPDEQELLARARGLRAVIEHPERQQRTDQPPAALPVATAVQHAFDAAEPAGTPVRRAVLAWARPALVAAVERITAGAQPGPVRVRASTPGGAVAVTAAGADPAQVQAAKQAAAVSSVSAVPRNVVLVCAAAALVLGVIVLVSGGHLAFAVVAFLTALALGGYGAKRWWDMQREIAQRARDVAAVDNAVGAAITRAQERQRKSDELRAQLEKEQRAALAALSGLAESATQPRRD